MSSLTVNVNDQSYPGHQIRPTVKDSNNNTQITAKLGTVNIDLGQFTISYPDSKDANGKEVNVANQSFIYDGKAHTFASATFNYSYTDPITHKTVKLEEGKDFEIKYFHNVTGNANHEAYIAVVGKGNYAGNNDTTNQVFEDENGQKVNAITYKKFTITPVQLSDQNVTVSNGTYAEGMAVKPVVKVSYGRDALTLEEGKDYKLVGVGAYTEPTTTKKYTVSVEGINGYTGTTSSVNWGIDKKDLADCDITAAKNSKGSVSVVVMNGNVKVPTEKYVVTENADGTVTVTPAKDSKYYIGSKTVTLAGSEANEKPGTPMISNVKVVGNKATVILSGDTDGAAGYDYVISTDRDCITNKDYTSVNKNQVQTSTTFKYVQQGTYYAYCHAWKRDENPSHFDWGLSLSKLILRLSKNFSGK
ncbi:MAG: hypothetical protein E7B45_17190 [Lachnospiraceae bacterium]|nr:hypothetical protein [Lachnospiraceae bacterium]